MEFILDLYRFITKHDIMGFSDYASSILRNNKRLRSRSKDNYGLNVPSYNQAKYPESNKLSSAKLERARKRRNKKIVRQVLPVFLLTLLLVFTLIFFLNRMTVDYTGKINHLKTTEKTEENFTAFKVLVDSGNKYLIEKDYAAAQAEFVMALKIAPTSKIGNIGLCKALIMNCEQLNLYCNESMALYEQLLSSKNISNKEHADLVNWKYSSENFEMN